MIAALDEGNVGGYGRDDAAVPVGRDQVDVNCVGWADKEAQTPLRLDHILMLTNRLADGVWMRFPMTGELPGRGHGLAGGLILQPSPLDHPDAAGELYWGEWRARNGGFHPSAMLRA
jgi:hypothetical protein